MKKFIAVAMFLICFNIYGEAKLDSLLNSGIEKSYQCDFEGAEKIFRAALNEFKESPAPYYYIARIHLWKYLGSKNEDEYKLFLRFSEECEKFLDKAMDKEESADLLLIAGKLYQDKATVLAARLKAVDAFWAARKSNSYFNDVLDEDPKNQDALLGTAIYNYTLKFVPGFFRWVLSITGLDSNEELALNKLLSAGKNNRKINPELNFHLSLVYSEYIAEYDSAETLLSGLCKTYPKNIVFLYQLANVQLKNRKPENAIKTLKKITDLNDSNFKQTTGLAYYLLGEAYFVKNDFSIAVKSYEEFIKMTLDNNFMGHVSLRLAICYYALKNPTLSKKNFLDTKLGNEELVEDSYAMQMGEQYFKKGFTYYDLLVWKIRNYLMSGEYDKVLKLSESSLQILKSSRKAWVSNFYLEALIRKRKYDRCVDLLSVEYKVKKDDRHELDVYSSYLHVLFSFNKGENGLAASEIDKIKNPGSYYSFVLSPSEIAGLQRKLTKTKKSK